MVEFKFQAEKMFSQARSLEPYRLEGMEIYSTALWHLQRDVELSTLAQELSDLDKNSPEVSKNNITSNEVNCCINISLAMHRGTSAMI